MKLDQLMTWYQTLSPNTLSQIDEIYHEQANFRDPFNHVEGVDQIAAIFQHMFDTTERAQFLMGESQVEGNVAWVDWHFRCGMMGREIAFDGATRLEFAEDGRVMQHRDYWDATDLYQYLPLLGRISRMLKRRFKLPIAHSSPGSRQL
jgi:limonene-1,2-epoxide hydrolase